MEANEIVRIAANALNEKKARELKCIEISDLTALAECFVIASATSSTHVHSLADEVEAKLEEAGERPHHIEGKSTGWICLDYKSVVVHIFTPDQREFYSLDKMWSDGKEIALESILDNIREV